MRPLVTLLVLILSLSAAAQSKPKTVSKPTKKPVGTKQATKKNDELSLGSDARPVPAPSPQRNNLRPISAENFPLNSVLHFVPHQKTLASASLDAAFGSESQETIIGPNSTATDKFDVRSYSTNLEVDYGILPHLSLGANIGYGTNTVSNSEYHDTNGNIFPLGVDVKSKGLTDPNLLIDYRLLDSDLIVDLAGALRLGFIGAVRGVGIDTTGDSRTDTATQGNLASGSYGVKAGVRAGYKLSHQLSAIASLAATYNFDGQVTVKTNVSEYVANVDSNLSLKPQVSAEYFVTKEFALNPFVGVELSPKQKSHVLNAGVSTNSELAAAKIYSVGLNATYLAMADLAIRGGYTYSSSESRKLNQSVGGAPMALSHNTKDADSHTLSLQAIYEF